MKKLVLVVAVALVIYVLCVPWIWNGGQHISLNPLIDLRARLREAHNLSSEISLTKQTCEVGQVFRYTQEKSETVTMTETFYNLLPDDVTKVFRHQPYKSCSVVGNGGILLQSGCGKDIDAANFVFRCNLPPLDSFEEDAGSKSNFTTLNPSTLWRRYNSLQTAADSNVFAKRIKQLGNSFVLVPAFVTKNEEENIQRLNNFLTERKNDLHVQLLYPTNSLLDSIKRFWREESGYRLKEARVTSGLYLLTLALSWCQQVNVYGFYPSHISPWKSYLRFHYYSPYSFFSYTERSGFGVHDMAEEYAILENLHQRKIIQLRLRCQDTGTNN